MGNMVYIVIALIVLILIWYFGVKYQLDQKVARGDIDKTVAPSWWLCPSDWKKQKFADQELCVAPDAWVGVDRCLNVVDINDGTCPDANKRQVGDAEYCLSNNEINIKQQQLYHGWGCLKEHNTTAADVKIPQ